MAHDAVSIVIMDDIATDGDVAIAVLDIQPVSRGIVDVISQNLDIGVSIPVLVLASSKIQQFLIAIVEYIAADDDVVAGA